MKTVIASLLAAGLLVAFSGADSAEAKSKKQRRHYDSYAQKYPSATPRQLQNARAYDRGQYYEMDSNAHPVGTRAWWDLKQRENAAGRP
jgi:hypothetical protein